MSRIRKVLTFSNVVACLALFIALGGTVYAAGKISGKQIKRASLPGNRIKPKTIAANRIKPKSLTGRQVKGGSLTGAQINQKTLTAISAAGLASVQYQATTVTLSSTARGGATATAECPAGAYAVGGGATVSNEELASVNDSGPSALRNGWTATGFTWVFNNPPTMTVTAVCVAVGKPTSSSTTTAGPRYQPAG